LPARPATAVLSTILTRKKASTASITKPAKGVIVTLVTPTGEVVRERGRAEAAGRRTVQHGPQQVRGDDCSNELAHDVAGRLAGAHCACSEHADSDGWIHMPTRGRRRKRRP
jgi:hypothetical protein